MFSFVTQTNISDIDLNNLYDVPGQAIVLLKTDEENIIPLVKEIFSLIYKTNVTIMLVKRFATQIMSYAFDFYKNSNPRFEMVTHDASQIYPIRIFFATDTETVAYHVFELLNLMHSNYVSLSALGESQEIINQIVSMIDKEYNNPNLSLEYIAEQCGISTYKIGRYFKKVCNTNYIDYLTNVRVNHSKNYLKNSKYTLEEISTKIGYTNISTFMRAFKKNTGETPNQYRKKLRI